MVRQATKKPVTIDFIQWTGDNTDEITAFCPKAVFGQSEQQLFISTEEGVMTGSKYDVIIKGVKGEFYPCKPDIFVKSYDFDGNITLPPL